jgi:hypothetical protein
MTSRQPPEKQSKKSSGRGGARTGAGRPKGSLDKGNAAIREMIVSALNAAGGVKYLQGLALSHPPAFASLVGKAMPLQVTGEDGGALIVKVMKLTQGA